MEGLIGIKKGMTQVWDDAGNRVGVTVIEAGPCPVVQVKTVERDGYEALQLGFGPQKASRMSRAEVARFDKAGIDGPYRMLREFKVGADSGAKAGDMLTVSMFEGVSHVDVVGVSKGRGFAGVVRRWGFKGGPKSHGSQMRRGPGSIGARQDPGNVQKKKKMAGHMGSRRTTVQNLKIVGVRPEDNVILVAGAVPGPNGGTVLVSKALKKKAVN